MGTTATDAWAPRQPPAPLLHNLLAAGKANQSILEEVDPEGIIAGDVNIDPQVKLLPTNEVGLVQISAEGSKHMRVRIFICRNISNPQFRSPGKTRDQCRSLFAQHFQVNHITDEMRERAALPFQRAPAAQKQCFLQLSSILKRFSAVLRHSSSSTPTMLITIFRNI